MLQLQNLPATGKRRDGGRRSSTSTRARPPSTSRSTCGTRDWGLEGRLEYSTALFDAGSITRMLEHLEVLLTAMADDVDARLSQLPMLTSAARHQLLVEWNRTEYPTPPDTAVDTLFEAEAARRPEAVAVEAGDRRLTYAELHARANVVADDLRRRGVAADVPVAVCMGRSLEWPIALLGVLKAGGAYVPLDPTHPHGRLLAAVRDSGAKIVIADAAQYGWVTSLHPSIDVYDVGTPRPDRPRVRPHTPARCDPTPGRPRLHCLHLWNDRRAKGRRGSARRA